MSSNIGGMYFDGEPASPARRNATSVISDTGTNLTSIPNIVRIPLRVCTEDGGGLKIDEVYVQAADGLSLKNVRRKHLHNDDTDESGGPLLKSFINNLRLVLIGLEGFNRPTDFIITKHASNNSTFLELTNSTVGRYHQLRSLWNAGGSTGEWINAAIQTAPVGFSKEIMCLMKIQPEHNNNMVTRVGMGMEDANAGTDTNRKIGIEACNATTPNWQIVSADGATRTVTPTTMDVAPSAVFRTYQLYFNPETAELHVRTSDGATKKVTSTLPSGGQIEPHRTFRAGVTTTNATEKKLWLSLIQIMAWKADVLWQDAPILHVEA